MSKGGLNTKYILVGGVRVARHSTAAALGPAASAVAATTIDAASVAPAQDLMGVLKKNFLTDSKMPITADNLNFTNLRQALLGYSSFKDLERDSAHATECAKLKKAVAICVLKGIYRDGSQRFNLDSLKFFLTDDYTSKQISKDELNIMVDTETNKTLLQQRATSESNPKTKYREIGVNGQTYVLVNYHMEDQDRTIDLGSGTFGRARTAWSINSETNKYKKEVAVKKLEIQDAEDLCKNYLEYCAQKGLAGDYVVEPYAFVAREGNDFKKRPVLIFQEKGVG